MNARAIILSLLPAAQVSAQTEWRKYECNPILEGTPGGWDPFLDFGLTVVFDGSAYQLWYTGSPSTMIRHQGIGRATSADGIHWNKDPASAPVLKSKFGNEWDSSGVLLPFVYHNGQSFVMFYEGSSSRATGVAISSNGVDWSQLPGANPVLAQGPAGSWDEQECNCVSVLRTASPESYLLWYSGLRPPYTWTIGLAVSGDGLAGWRKDEANPIMGLGPNGGWDSQGLACPMVVSEGTKLHLWYSATNSLVNETWRIGYATSTDPAGREWKRYPGNPVLRPGPAGTWDSLNADVPSVLFNEKRNLYQMWYLGDRGRGRDVNTFAIGYAESPLAHRTVALPLNSCLPGSRVNITVRQESDGRDSGFALKLREIVTGPILASQVTGSLLGAARVVPRQPVTRAGIFQDARAVGRVPFCAGGNGAVRFSEPDGSYVFENLGEDIGTGGDSFTFAYSRVRGDFTLTAHIKTPGPRPGGAGLMVRRDLSNRSKFSFTHDRWGDTNPGSGDPLDATRWSSRPVQGGYELVEYPLDPGSHFDWLRIARSGARVTGSYSEDGGKTFVELGSDAWPSDNPLFAGLCFSSLTSACCKGPSTIEFDQVKLDLAPGAELLPPEPPPEGVEITWGLTRGDLKAGVTYEIAIDSGDLHFIAGEDGIAVAGESRVHLAPPACERFRRGDVDGDGTASITDPVLLLSHLFLGGAAPGCPDAADADDSGVLDLTDAIYDLDWQFLGGPAPPAPGPGACGSDPTAEDPPLGTCVYDPARC